MKRQLRINLVRPSTRVFGREAQCTPGYSLEIRECWSTSDPDYLAYLATLADWQVCSRSPWSRPNVGSATRRR